MTSVETITRRRPTKVNRLGPDELADIANLLPVYGMNYVCDWLGTTRNTVRKHAERLGVKDWPRRNTGGAVRAREQDIPGVAKACSKCGKVKPLEMFQRNRLGHQGRRPECKACGK